MRDGKPLVYLDSGGHLAEADVGARRRAGLLRAAQRRRPPRRAPARRGGAPRLTSGPGAVAAFVGARHDEVVWTKNATEGINLVAYASPTPPLGRRSPGCGSRWARRRGRSSPRWSTTPTSCRGRSLRAAPARPCAGSRSPTRAGSTSTPLDASAHRAHQGVRRSPTRPTCSARSTRSRELAARAHGGRRAHRARRLPVGAAPAGRRRTASASTSLAFSGHKMLGPIGLGGLCGRRECSTRCRRSSPAARWSRRSRMDALDLRRRRRRSSRPARRRSAQASGWTPPCEYLQRARHGPGRRPRARAHRAAARRARRACRASASSGPTHGRRPRRRRRVRRRRRARRTTSARCSTHAGVAVRVGHHCAQPLHRRFGVAASTRATVCLTPPPARSTRSSTRSTGVPAIFGRGRGSIGPLPAAHPRPLQATAPGRPARAVRRRGAPGQPALR